MEAATSYREWYNEDLLHSLGSGLAISSIDFIVMTRVWATKKDTILINYLDVLSMVSLFLIIIVFTVY